MATAILLSLPAFAQQYNSNDLTPLTAASAKLNGASSGKQAGGSGNGHAMLSSGNALNSIDLHPSVGYSSSMATATDDLEQCGYAFSTTTFRNHAMKWSGSASSYTDLHGAISFDGSYCLGTHGGQQVGYGERPVYFTTYQNAFVWSGGVATNLHPALGYGYSKALAVRNGQQVGYGSSLPYPYGETFAYHAGSRALVWAGTAASFVDINPLGYDASEAWATNGTRQGGLAYLAFPTPTQHAALWSGTADSFVDLHPAGYNDSRVTAMSDTQQVGDGWVGPMGAPGSVRHALVWNGTAQSVIDLNQYLPAGYAHAVATGVDANGNVVGFAYNTPAIGLVMPPDAIAVVFAPGQASANSLASLVLTPSNPAPGATVQGVVSLGGAAASAGVTISLAPSTSALLPVPSTVFIPGGQTSASFSFLAAGSFLQAPAFAKVIASDGVVTRAASVNVTPVVNIASAVVNPVEGGFNTTGTLTLTIPAQAGGAAVTLSTASPLVTLPASVTLAQGQSSIGFAVATTPVSVPTAVPFTAAFNGQTLSGTITLSPAPVVAVATLTIPFTVGGQSQTGTITVTNFPRGAEGAVITLTSGDTRTLQVPPTVTIPQGAISATFPITTTIVNGSKGVAVKAVLGASSLTTTASVVPIPSITIVQADYLTDLNMLKVAATSSLTNAVFTFGVDPLGPAIGTLQLELGQYKGATIMATAPATVTVWSSDGGQATMAVTRKLSSSGGGSTGGGGGGGGGGSTSSTYKLTIAKSGKGAVTSSLAGASFAPNTSVTLTATPDPGSAWTGWTGACTGTSLTCVIVMTSDKSVTANFR